MLPNEETTRQARSAPDGHAQSGIAGDRTDECPTSGPGGPASERTLFGFTHAGTLIWVPGFPEESGGVIQVMP
jgi:hypothetical protein